MNEQTAEISFYFFLEIGNRPTLSPQYDAIILITTINKQGIRGNAKEIS